jgi:formamidopyrimidine-DNA glycosylase
MPELPEVMILARQLNERICGKTISAIEVLQPKCLNLELAEFQTALNGATIRAVSNRGKWILTDTSMGWLLLNLGMGGELLLVTRTALPEKYRLVFDFSDDTCLAVNFWWFGYVHYAPSNGLDQHPMVSKLGPNALDVGSAELQDLLKTQRGQIKAFLLDQSRLAGIGNSYVHDILFLARLHPQRKIDGLSETEISELHTAIHQVLELSLEKGGAAYEMDTYGHKGGFSMEDIHIGYREGQPCPVCGTAIQKIKTGSTSGFICPDCQKI